MKFVVRVLSVLQVGLFSAADGDDADLLLEIFFCYLYFCSMCYRWGIFLVVFGVYICGEGVHVFSFCLVPLPCSLESERSQCFFSFYLVLYKEGRTKYMVSNIVGTEF